MNYNTDEEVWKDVIGFEGIYKVSNVGRLMRYKNSVNMPDRNILKGEVTVFGYRQYKLSLDGMSRRMKAHRLVAQSFIPNPDNKPQVNHKDGNKLNNRVDNLEWATSQENNQHALDTGLREVDMKQVRAMHKTMAKKQQKKVAQYDLNGNFIKTYNSLKDTAKDFKTSTNIGRVCRGLGNTAYGYKWEYID